MTSNFVSKNSRLLAAFSISFLHNIMRTANKTTLREENFADDQIIFIAGI